MDQTPLRQIPASTSGSKIRLLHPGAEQSIIPRNVPILQQPQTAAVQSSSSAVSPPPSDMIPPSHLKYVDMSDFNARKRQVPPKPKPEPPKPKPQKAKPKQDNSKKPKKKKSIQLNPKQAAYISSGDIKMMVKNKLEKPPKKRAPLLISSAIKALTVNLLKNAAEKALENGTNIVAANHLEDAALIVAECI